MSTSPSIGSSSKRSDTPIETDHILLRTNRTMPAIEGALGYDGEYVRYRSNQGLRTLSLNEAASFLIFRDENTIKVKNGNSGNIDYRGQDAAEVIQSALKEVNVLGGGWVHIKGYGPKNPYKITSPIELPESGHLILTGDGANFTVLQVPQGSDNSIFQFSGPKTRDNAYFNYFAFMKLQGNKGAGSDSNTGFKLDSTEFGIADTTFYELFLRDFRKDCIYISSANAWNNKVLNCTIEYAGGAGIRKVGGSDFRILNSKFLFNDSHALVLGGSFTTLTDCWFYKNRGRAIHMGGGTFGNIITSNRFQDNGKGQTKSLDDIYLEQGVRNIIGNNVFFGGVDARFAINLLPDSNDNLITGNIFWNRNYVSPIINDGGTKTRIANNLGYNPLGTDAIMVGPSPFTYTAGSSPETVYVLAGTVTTISKGDTILFTSTDRSVELEPNGSIVVTYTNKPKMVKDRH